MTNNDDKINKILSFPLNEVLIYKHSKQLFLIRGNGHKISPAKRVGRIRGVFIQLFITQNLPYMVANDWQWPKTLAMWSLTARTLRFEIRFPLGEQMHALFS